MGLGLRYSIPNLCICSEYSGGISNLDTSAMAKISDGYTIGAIDACLREVMSCKRKLQLRSQPLTNAELINVLW